MEQWVKSVGTPIWQIQLSFCITKGKGFPGIWAGRDGERVCEKWNYGGGDTRRPRENIVNEGIKGRDAGEGGKKEKGREGEREMGAGRHRETGRGESR